MWALQGMPRPNAAYQKRLDYAKDRLQGRAVTGAENPDGPADPADRAPRYPPQPDGPESLLEGARAFTLWGAQMIDRAHRENDDLARADLVSLLTPVLKGFLTDQGFEMTVQAQQVFGGHGYIEETGHEPVRPRCANCDDL